MWQPDMNIHEYPYCVATSHSASVVISKKNRASMTCYEGKLLFLCFLHCHSEVHGLEYQCFVPSSYPALITISFKILLGSKFLYFHEGIVMKSVGADIRNI
jgi:hypothetical protein